MQQVQTLFLVFMCRWKSLSAAAS